MPGISGMNANFYAGMSSALLGQSKTSKQTGFDLTKIGNVGQYAKSLVKSYTEKAQQSAAASDDSYTNVISRTVSNNAKFVSTNNSNLKSLKSSASALERAANGMAKSSSSSDDLVTAAQNFATSYNNTVSHLTSGGADGAGVSKALGYVTNNRITAGSAASYGSYAANRMADMGITIDEDGTMSVDAEKLKAAADQSPATVKSMLVGRGSISQVTQENANQALRIPAATYTDFSNMQASDSLLDALLPSVGSLFDILA